jgi:hypothetical protein
MACQGEQQILEDYETEQTINLYHVLEHNNLRLGDDQQYVTV